MPNGGDCIMALMKNADPTQLLKGPYSTPRFRIGRRVNCLMRGSVTIVGMTDARIQWPVGKKLRARGPVIYRDLAKALRVESALAICYWWGVTPQTVTKWRKALGIATNTKGTSDLRRRRFNEPWGFRARKLAWAKANDPERCRKIAEAKMGKPRPKHVIEAMLAAKRRIAGKKAAME
jgi:hypothetical protein